jgi:hypothetical protein
MILARFLAASAASLAVVLATGCSCGTEGTSADGGPGGPGIDARGDLPDGTIIGPDGPIGSIDGGPGTVITEDGGFTWTCRPTSCAGRFTECGDCEDNDGDGLTDSRDRECLGPCDNTETPALLAGVGGETGGPCLADCYFDFGNGPGNDDCHWDHRCDPLAVGPDFPPEGSDCQYDEGRVDGMNCPDPQSEMCHTICSPLTPAGCDCFGCCTFPEITDRPAAEGGPHVWIGSVIEGTNTGTCTFEEVTNVEACRPCTPVADCYNDCGRCELCIGRTEIPADCYPPDAGPGYDAGPDFDGGPPYDGGVDLRCPVGQQYCGLPGEPECPVDYYCVTGCCVPTLI